MGGEGAGQQAKGSCEFFEVSIQQAAVNKHTQASRREEKRAQEGGVAVLASGPGFCAFGTN